MSEREEPTADRETQARHDPQVDRPRGEELQRADRRIKRPPDEGRVGRRRRRATAEPTKGEAPRPGRKKRRRWIKRVTIVLVVLLILAVAGVQLVLSSGLPRKFVLRTLEQQLGLRVGAETLATGWGGYSTLNNVTLAMPLAEEAFFTMPRLEVRHTNLPMLLIGRPVRIAEIRLQSPRLVVKQDALGRWNVQEAIALITRAAGGKSADEERKASGGRAVPLPKLSLVDGTLVLTDRHGQSSTLAPLELRGEPQGSLAWHFGGRIGEEIEITDGRVAPGQNWSHQARLALRELGTILKPWAKNFPHPFELAGEWQGQVEGSVVTGRLDLQHGRVKETAFAGVIGLRTQPGGATITPETLLADFGNKKPLPVRLSSGALAIEGTRIVADQLRLSLLGGSSLISGNFDWHTDAGEVSAEWVDLTLGDEAGIRHQGKLSAKMDRTIAGGPQLKGELSTSGKAPRGTWDARMAVDAEGASWSRIDWRVAFPHLVWDEKQYDLRLANLNARLSTRDSVIRLDSVRLADTNRVNATGLYDTNRGDWWLWLDTREVHVPFSRYVQPANVMLNAAGSRNWINLSDLYVSAGLTTISGYGFYDFDVPKPLNASLHVWRPVRDPAAPTPQEAAAAQHSGILRGDLKITGVVTRPDIEISGDAFGENVRLGQRQLGDLRVAVRGTVNSKGAALWSEQLELLEGRWAFRGDYDREKDLATLHVDALGLSLGQADAFFKPPPNLIGMVDAELHMDVPHRDREQISASGDFVVRGFRKGQIVAEEVRGGVTFEQDQLTISNIELQNEKGTGNGEVRYNFNDPGRVSVKLAVRDWPLETRRQSIRLRTTAEAALEIDGRTGSINGPANASGSIVLRGADAGRFSAAANFAGRRMELQSLAADVLGGRLEGQAGIDMNDVLTSTALVEWKDFDVALVQEMFPAIEGLEGRISGSLAAGKPTSLRAGAPMRVQLDISSNGASYEGIELGEGHFTFLLDRTHERPAGMPDRIVLQRSTLELADGMWELWARASTPSEQLFGNVHTQIHFRDVDLNQIVHGFAPEAQPMVGTLAGEITVFGSPTDYRNLYGEANLQLTRSDLVNSDIIGAFYNAFNLAPDVPHGRGNAYARLEAGTLRIISLFYRVTGLEVRASGEVADVWRKADSPIAGHAAGSVRQLGDIKLPLFAEVDEVLAALQQGLVTVEVGGTVREPDVRAVLFSEINSDLRTIILGDVKAATKGTAGR